MLPSTLQFLIVMIGCAINERLQKALDYKSEEVVILKGILREVRELVIRLARENLCWGYTKIRDAVSVGLQVDICRNTVANILHEAGVVPAPERDKKRIDTAGIRSA
jgi:hypothetical protein